jgi:LAS superfamily LD-carboxypeptidase LdcB
MQMINKHNLIFVTLLFLSTPLWAAVDEAPEEFVVINNASYPIPSPWRGHKVKAPSLTVPPLMQIPMHLTENESKLYLLKDACLVLIMMAEEAEKEGIHLKIDSSYRSSWYQKKIFMRMMAEGREFDDIIRYVAPPGYSEHALGTVVDFTPSNWRFAGTSAYVWLQTNGKRFGFFETLPEYPERNTPWEAWHWQYLGLVE